jgi:hypothetical protein
MSDDLREKMIALIREGFHDKPFTPENIADAAIDLVLEEAAKICDRGVDTEHPIVKGHIMKNFSPSSTLAAAIRALKGV